MNKSKNKNTPNPTNGGDVSNNGSTTNYQTKDRDNAIENIKTTHPTKK